VAHVISRLSNRKPSYQQSQVLYWYVIINDNEFTLGVASTGNYMYSWHHCHRVNYYVTDAPLKFFAFSDASSWNNPPHVCHLQACSNLECPFEISIKVCDHVSSTHGPIIKRECDTRTVFKGVLINKSTAERAIRIDVLNIYRGGLSKSGVNCDLIGGAKEAEGRVFGNSPKAIQIYRQL
jgi:hypothetical protein